MGDSHDRSTLSRRAVVAAAGSLLAAGILPRLKAHAEDKPAPPNAIPPSEALERLRAGNARYVANGGKGLDYSPGRVAQVDGQYPIAGVLSSSDSPVPPEIVLDQGPGDLFVARNAGNVVTGDVLASFEFALTYHEIPLIFVLGHSNCGAVLAALSATVQRKQFPGNLAELMKAMEPAVIAAHGKHSSDPLRTTVEENVRLGMKRLKTQSTIVGEAVMAGKLKIAGGVLDLKTGIVKSV